MRASPRIYTDLAPWWPLLSAPADYAEEAAQVRTLANETADGPVRTLLELGSGGGNNASHLAGDLELTLVDRSPDMLAVSRALNPGCTHVTGDMRDVRLARTFDAVFVHDAVMYMTTEDDLRAALTTVFAHCRPGGAAIVAPDVLRENFAPGTSFGGHDAPDGRGLRYLEWRFDPDPADTTYEVHYALLLREPDGSTTSAEDHHVMGLFSHPAWVAAFASVGFAAPCTQAWSIEGTPLQWFVAQRPYHPRTR